MKQNYWVKNYGTCKITSWFKCLLMIIVTLTHQICIGFKKVLYTTETYANSVHVMILQDKHTGDAFHLPCPEHTVLLRLLLFQQHFEPYRCTLPHLKASLVAHPE